LIVVGAAVILTPNFPLVKMILLSQVINGVLLPFVLIFMTILVNKSKLMQEWTNTRFYNLISWVSVALMIGLTMALVALSIKDMIGAS
jgi:Mn2+/Fe2+ NRAMP family transporter